MALIRPTVEIGAAVRLMSENSIAGELVSANRKDGGWKLSGLLLGVGRLMGGDCKADGPPVGGICKADEWK